MQAPEKIIKLHSYFSKFEIWDKITNEIEKLERLIVALNRQQIKRGTRSDGTQIQPPYKQITIEFKSNDGTLTNGDPTIVNLYDTGSFYAGFYVLVSGDQIIIDSTDGKTDELQDKYGEKIFDLNESNLKTVLEKIKNAIIEDVKRHI